MIYTDPALALQMSELLSKWLQREREYNEWITGTATGGTNLDGLYPLTTFDSGVKLVKSPARLQADVDGLTNSALSYRNDAQSALAQVQTIQTSIDTVASAVALDRTTVNQLKLLAEAAQADAQNSRNISAGYRNTAELKATEAANSAAAALTSETNANLTYIATVALRDETLGYKDLTLVYKTDAELARDQAVAAVNYYTKPEVDQMFYDLVNGAPETLDTLNELALAFQNNADTIANLEVIASGKADSIHTHPWSDITGKPATFTPSAHNHPTSEVTGLDTALALKVPYTTGTNLDATVTDWSKGIGLATNSTSSSNFPTLYGFSVHFASGAGNNTSGWQRDFTMHHQSSSENFYLRAHNQADGTPLPWRKVWTEATFDPSSKAEAIHGHAWSEITSIPSTASRWPTWSEVTSKPSTFAPSAHGHAWSEITSIPSTASRWPTWSEVTSKPATFAPSAHTHTWQDLSNLGVFSGSSNLDPDTTTSRYILTNHANSPAQGVYWYVTTNWWGSGGNMSQFAVSYNGSEPKMAWRHKYGSSWTVWRYAVDKLSELVGAPASVVNVTDGNNNTMIVNTSSGTLQVGAQNTSYAHFITDRPLFYMNKALNAVTGFNVHGSSTTLRSTYLQIAEGAKRGVLTISTGTPTGTPADGDEWVQY